MRRKTLKNKSSYYDIPNIQLIIELLEKVLNKYFNASNKLK
jgi:hypothetical protein